MEITVVDPGSSGARAAMTRYFNELAVRFEQELDVAALVEEARSEYVTPVGAFVVAGDLEEPVGCGAVHFLDADRAEIKRMWVAPEVRGRGVAKALLDHLEGLVVQQGVGTAVLDTNRSLTEAIAMYERCGYVPIPRYNDNPYADYWFALQL